ncbi:MAG: glycerol-3-phosphate dehydrogenase/oxidase [Gemmatimonadota bacterium]|nr:glycerol-3-phosphate dehydrogenase/oxidase [Gemmatimonadota bacterium]
MPGPKIPACQVNHALGGCPRSLGFPENNGVDASFSAESRTAALAAMSDGPVDILIVGGGITGAGIAREAAMRGFRTALVDRADFGAGTSSRSSRLVHGGLRYLEHGAFRLVFEASRERRTLLRIAPHLVWPRSFLFPLFAGGRVPPWKLAAGLWIYDGLALLRNVRAHRWLSKRAMLRAEPGLRSRDLRGGARYYDAQCDDARLTLATVRAAHRHGALVANYAAVESFETADGRVRGARVVDRFTGARIGVRALVTVNATGPWSDRLRGDGLQVLRPTKGVHVVVPRARLGTTEALTLLSPVDGRVLFILPWDDLVYIGTTDTDYAGDPDAVRADGDDVVYLLRSANAVLPDARLRPDDIIATWAGLRPLLRSPGARDPAAVSREHRILDAPGLLSVVGGKLTTYRVMAAEAIDRAAAALHALDGRPIPPRAPTATEPLPGGEMRDPMSAAAELEHDGLAPALAARLARVYGAEAPAIGRLVREDPRLAAPIAAGTNAIRAELLHGIRREMAMTLCDLLLRRTHVFYEVRGHAAGEAAGLVDLVGHELGWNAARKAQELADYLAEAERSGAFRAEVHAGP